MSDETPGLTVQEYFDSVAAAVRGSTQAMA